LPLPNGISEESILKLIPAEKDVDGFLAENLGNLAMGKPSTVACTPFGVIKMLKRENIELSGKNAVVIGRSNIVGKPMAMLLLNENCTVTICHSKTKNLKEICSQADILVAAIGKPEFVKQDMVKEGAVVIDVGINRLEKGLVGDVDFNEVSKKASFITPVPGGVGPMTIAMLMENTYNCALRRENDL
jgi:methylenetetrahydrofolate dehydrogenase (NADP+)/methenyltetrahydrofolate cyclohydrolase